MAIILSQQWSQQRQSSDLDSHRAGGLGSAQLQSRDLGECRHYSKALLPEDSSSRYLRTCQIRNAVSGLAEICLIQPMEEGT